ncbi:DUF6037 family protein [Bacillus pumilus]|uniref:DUF6037 family protein n=1 Tax=Bacillus TaxID=1386 RepID=UPI0016582BF4|nr:DUF6037 family protein [Bacillus pumilus]QNP17043.1 hypothetical protein H9S87_03260 [Bacillus pumilus]
MLENLKTLKNDMVNKNWTISSFWFTYKRVSYVVLVKRFVGSEKRINRYALVKLHFMKVNDLTTNLIVEANVNGLLIDTKTLREFFGIEFTENLGDIIKQFTNQLAESIPEEIPTSVTDIEKSAMVESLSKSDSEDPNKIYCNRVGRNSGSRSEFNSDKTKLLRPSLYKHFENDSSISFFYSTEKERCNDDATILKNFSNNKSL